MIPEGWGEYTLKYLSLVERGKFSARPRNDPKFFGGDMPFVQTGDVTSSGTYLKRFSQTLNNEGVAVSKVFPKGTVLITIAANIGDTAITEFEVACPDSIVAIQPYKEKANSYWIKKVLETKKSDLDSRATQNAQKNINLQVLKPLLLLTPPLLEQKKIAKILSTWDKAISTTEKLLTNSSQQKKALMQQLLTGKKRLLDKNGVKFSGEWDEYKLGKLFVERVEINREDLPLLSITADDGVVYQEETGRKNTSNDDKSKYRRICVNDIGYNTMRMWQGRSSLSDKEGIVSPAYTIVVPGKEIAPAFAAYLFKLEALIHLFYRHSQGLVSDTWNLKFNHFKNISWRFPAREEQQKIATVLSAADKEIETLQQKLAHLKQEKKALMQQLLTGKRRVNVEVA